MLHGNPQACAQALRRAGLDWDDIAVIEINEAFASVVLQTLADTGLGERWAAGDVNPNGGGISLGHPLGATGARITATLLNELERREARYGIASMCIGLGQAIAAVIERSSSLPPARRPSNLAEDPGRRSRLFRGLCDRASALADARSCRRSARIWRKILGRRSRPFRSLRLGHPR